MNLSFAGCGFLGVYHLGVAKCLVDHAPNFLRSIKAFAGASAGSLAAAMLATSAPIDKCSDYVVDLTNEARKNPLGPFSRQFDLVGNLRKGMEEYLPSDCHKIASGRLFISVTSLKNRKNYVISEYESKDELMKVQMHKNIVKGFDCSHVVECINDAMPLSDKIFYSPKKEENADPKHGCEN